MVFSVVDDALCDDLTLSPNVTKRPTTRQTTSTIQETMEIISESNILLRSSGPPRQKLFFSVVDDARCDDLTLSPNVTQRSTTRQTTSTILETMRTIDESAITSTSLAPLLQKLNFSVIDDALCDISTLSPNVTQRPTTLHTTPTIQETMESIDESAIMW